MKYKKIGDTEIVKNSLPQEKQNEAEVWDLENNFHDYTITPTDILEGQFKLFVSVSLKCPPQIGISAILLTEMKRQNPEKEIKTSDTYIQFTTLDTYDIEESERDNLELYKDLIKAAINSFNHLLQKHKTTFWMGRLYELPSDEAILEHIKN